MYLLYFDHFFVFCYCFLFNQRLLEHSLKKALCFTKNIYIFLAQNDKNITNFLCYEITLIFCFMKLPERCHS